MADHTVGTDFQGRPVDRSISDAELESSHDYDNPEDYPDEVFELSDGRHVAELSRGKWYELDARGAPLRNRPVDRAIVENDFHDDID